MKKQILGMLVVGSLVATLLVLVGPAESKASETSVAQGAETETASTPNRFQIGLMGGPGVALMAGGGTTTSVGGHIEYKTTPYLGLGVFGMYSNYGSSD